MAMAELLPASCPAHAEIVCRRQLRLFKNCTQSSCRSGTILTVSLLQRLTAALELTVSDILAEVGHDLVVNFAPEVVTTLAELTVDKNQRTAQDLEAFAQHAKRSNITGEDVKLLTRRNSVLVSSDSKQLEPL